MAAIQALKQNDTEVSIGCEVNIEHAKTNQTPLGVAAEKNNEEVVRLLLDCGGIVDRNTPKFHNGDAVEARYQAGDHYFPGWLESEVMCVAVGEMDVGMGLDNNNNCVGCNFQKGWLVGLVGWSLFNRPK